MDLVGLEQLIEREGAQNIPLHDHRYQQPRRRPVAPREPAVSGNLFRQNEQISEILRQK